MKLVTYRYIGEATDDRFICLVYSPQITTDRQYETLTSLKTSMILLPSLNLHFEEVSSKRSFEIPVAAMSSVIPR